LQPTGEGLPFFIVNSFPYFVDLVKALGNDRPVLRLVGQEETEECEVYSVSIEAASHVKSIIERQPVGPYMLGGCSASGIVAYEVAQQLRAQGREVGLLVLFDTPNPYFMGEYSKLRMSLAYHRSAFARMRWREVPAWATSKLAGLTYRKLQELHLSLRGLNHQASEVFPFGSFPPRIECSRKYRPRPYGGDILLFKSHRQLVGRYLDPQLGWGEVARGKIEVVQLAATDHLEIFKSDLDRALVVQRLERSFAHIAATLQHDSHDTVTASDRQVESLLSLG
jgi:thioesterase domain-containing protein